MSIRWGLDAVAMSKDSNLYRIRLMTVADLNRVLALEENLQTHPWRRGHFENCLAIGNLALVVVDETSLGPAEQSNPEQIIAKSNTGVSYYLKGEFAKSLEYFISSLIWINHV